MSKFKVFKSIKKVFKKRFNTLSWFKSNKPAIKTIAADSTTSASITTKQKSSFWRSVLSFVGYKAGQVVIPAAASLVARTKAKEAMVGKVGSFVAGVIAEHAGATAYNLSSVYAGPIGAATTVVAISAKDFIRDVYVENTYGVDAEDAAKIECSSELLEGGIVDVKIATKSPIIRPSTIEMVDVIPFRSSEGLFDSASSDSLYSLN